MDAQMAGRPLSNNQIIVGAAVFGPLSASLCLIAPLALFKIAQGDPGDVFAIAPVMVLAGYVMGIVPAMVSALLLLIVRGRAGTGYLAAFVSGTLGTWACLWAIGLRTPDPTLSVVAGGIPAILALTATSQWVSRGPHTEDVRVPIRWRNGIGIAVAVHAVMLALTRYAHWP